MAKTEQLPDVGEARPHGNRAHVRRKLSPMAYVELGQDNGGILLNLGEGGFAVQSALALASREFSELRFQVPALQGWLKASGRIVWISDSKKEAGIQFTELPGEARREIQKWVSTDSESERVQERTPAASPLVSATRRPELNDADQQNREAPYRGGALGSEQTQAPNPHVNSTGATDSHVNPPPLPTSPMNLAPERNSPVESAPASSPVRPQREPARTSNPQTTGVAVAERSPQEFHFTDYSMFAAEPDREVRWEQQPGMRRGNWRRAALGLLAAGLFFVLGATVGKDVLGRWIENLGGWSARQLITAQTPKVTPPGPPDQNSEVAASEGQDRQAGKNTAEDDGSAASGGNPGPGPKASSPGGKSGNTGSGNAEAPLRKEESAQASRAPDMEKIAPNANEPPRPRHVTEGTWGRNDRGRNGELGKTESSEHAILVNAPEPGSRPFFVNLPGEAVSASGAIAISARRTLEIPPRSSAAASGSERVVIGKLILHSEPFYPAEARKRGIEGNVELRARVGRTGEVIGVTPVSGPWVLFPAAVNAVREWRYEPTFVNGDPTETLAEITIAFRLQ
jgi:TonB family protein